MKKLLMSCFFLSVLFCGFSQSQVFIGSTGTNIGSYDEKADVITPHNSLISEYLQQKHAGQKVVSFRIDKEEGIAYLISEVEYNDSDQNIRHKKVAERLFSSNPSERFSNGGDCEEHICDGACAGAGGIIQACTCCDFKRDNGNITGCKCCQTGLCCHTKKTCVTRN
jgi:predicted transcriptional regulator